MREIARELASLPLSVADGPSVRELGVLGREERDHLAAVAFAAVALPLLRAVEAAA
jgi:hypothetical protein